MDQQDRAAVERLKAAWTELTAPGGAFEVVTEDVRGIPMRVFKSALPNMRSLWEMAGLHGDKPYVVFEDEQYSYAEIGALVRSLAHVLRETYGVGSGDRVAIAMRNYPEWIVSYWATISIGAAVVGMNAWWTGPELAYALEDSTPKVLIADQERLDAIKPELAAVREKAALSIIAVRTEGELPSDAVAWSDVVDPESAPAGLPEATIAPDDDATIFYTSGTTGRPKGAQITHRGSVHNIFNLIFWTMVQGAAEAKRPADDTTEAPPSLLSTDGQTVFMAPTPLFHVTACNCLFHPATIAGGRLVLMYKWDAARALELIERERVTNFSGVPTMGRELILHPDWATRDTSSLKSIAGGGAPMQPDLVEKIEKKLSGSAPSTGYGLTETSGVVTVNSAQYYTAKPVSCGPLVPTLEGKLVDETGADLEPGPDVIGQLCVRGPVVIKGYLNRPEATAEAIQDGWFNTGDIGLIDSDGFVTLVDRAKDMVLRGGENVYCSEVEAAIYRHPAVLEAAVFGIPDERLGEKVAAVIVTATDGELDEQTLVEFIGADLAKFKIPERVWFRTEPLPRNANGKFLKRELRDQILA
ncbi:MAG: acyl--CoA ligase [Microthrixaceae bacterium]|nr:acyl--CoA ligase [Microthrixaceae bacterium]